MKKLINKPSDYVEEMLAGLVAANPSMTLDGASKRVIRRSARANKTKVGIASGGGSGHLPLFTGYVGPVCLTPAPSGMFSKDRMSSPAPTPSNWRTAARASCSSTETTGAIG